MGNKNWAKAYLLDPLTAPEPSQETGPGTSHYNALRSLSSPSASSSSNERNRSASSSSHQRPAPVGVPRKYPGRDNHQSSSSYPTPPGSNSPSRDQLSSKNPYRTPSTSTQQDLPRSVSASYRRHQLPNRPSSARFERPPPYRSEVDNSSVRRTASTRTSDPTSFSQRTAALQERYPGDMSHRPLDMIRQEKRAAERTHYTRHKPRKASETDIIDAMDTIGGTYHHGGPYDPTLASRNMKIKFSPVAAVEQSNAEALKATPKEYIQDSLTKHLPLQGTSTVPAGGQDLSGNVMEYEEGADLMREADAPGGAYKRWEGVEYHPDDLKGKGEPAFSQDRAAKAKRGELDRLLAPGGYELQSGVNKSTTAAHEQRSRAEPRSMASGNAFGEEREDGISRRNTTGKRFGEGIKRRIGSISRRKKEVEA